MTVMNDNLYDADPNVCCSAFQLGACSHTEADVETPIYDTRILSNGRIVMVDVDTRKVIRKCGTVGDPDFLSAYREGERYKCDNCSGDGVFRYAGYVENGVFKGKSGVCFHCSGKGYMTLADIKRCDNYNKYARKVYI
jgi:hypothetical protein